jgi:hypothetical protein
MEERAPVAKNLIEIESRVHGARREYGLDHLVQVTDD